MDSKLKMILLPRLLAHLIFAVHETGKNREILMGLEIKIRRFFFESLNEKEDVFLAR